MAKHGKKYTDIAKKAPAEVVSLEKAVEYLKAHPVAKFDETAEIAFRMGCDPKKQTIRGTVNLPTGTGKKVRVLVFAQGNAAIEGCEIPPLPPLRERMDTALAELRRAVEFKGEKIAVLEARKQLCWFLKGVPRAGEYKKDFVAMSTLSEAERIVRAVQMNLR